MNFVKQAFTKEDIDVIVREVGCDTELEIDFEDFMRMMRGTQKKKLDDSTTTASAEQSTRGSRFLFYRKYETTAA